MARVQSLSSPRLPAPRFRYSPLIKAGPFYRTAGMLGLDRETGKLEPGGAGAETAKILRNLKEALPDFGLSLDDLVSVNIYTTDMPNFPAINAAWESVFAADGHLPARTSIGVAALPLGATVEMEFTFYKE